jgi:2-polyprenyl-6-hydroxyphenyl methylase / 3-demethylubiquinone-9 3-methyltransferase
VAPSPAVDNDIYNQLSTTWWEDNGVLSSLRVNLNPGRFGYFRDILKDVLHLDPNGAAVLDVGCGGGLLAEEFARLGCRVTGIDPSAQSIHAAAAHAHRSGLEVDYRVGVGEQLQFEDASFPIVYCCDTLEHVQDVEQVIGGIARVLEPGGVFLYDTINRTFPSNLVMIKLLQDWDMTSMMPRNLHVWSKFITPDELHQHLQRHGLFNQESVGLSPIANPLALLLALRRRKRGELTIEELGRWARHRQSRDLSIIYMGYALKSGSAAAIS